MIKFELVYGNQNTIIQSPIGWQQLVFQLVRDDVYHGIDLNVSSDLTFIDNGFTILKSYVDNRDFDADIQLNLWYKDALIRKFKLNVFDYKLQSKQISCTVTEISFFEAIKNREGLDIDIYEPNNVDGQPLSVVSKLGFPFTFTSIPITVSSIIELNEDVNFIQEFTSVTGQFGLGLMPQIEIIEGGIIQTLVGGDTARLINTAMYQSPSGLKQFDLFHIDRNAQNPPLQGDYIIDWSISGTIGYSFTSADTFSATGVRILLLHGENAENEIVLYQNNSMGSSGGTSVNYSASGQEVITSPPKGKFRLAMEITGLRATSSGNPETFTFFSNDNNWDFTFTETTTLPLTQRKVTPIYEFTNRVLESITGKNDVLRSDYYGRTNSEPKAYSNNGQGSFKVVANGSNIRGFDELVNKESEDYRPPIIKWSDLFDSLNSIDNIGADVSEEFVRIEPKEYFYQEVLIKNLGQIKDVIFELKSNLYFNEIEIGYEDWEETIERGLSEFASTRQYSNRIKNNGSTLTLISQLLASPFAIEATRRDSKVFKPNAKSKWDNNNFIIETNKRLVSGHPAIDIPNIKDSPVFVPAGTAITDVQNAASGSRLYNIELSPTRNLLKHQNTIQGDLFFVSGKGNYKMKSTVENQFGGLELDEQQNLIKVPTLYYPITAKFEYPATIDEFMAWNDKKYGYFEFENCDNIFKAFIDSIEFDYSSNMCNFVLILKA